MKRITNRTVIRRRGVPFALSLGIALAALTHSPDLRAEGNKPIADLAPAPVDPPPTKEKPIDLKRAARGKAAGNGAVPAWAERYEEPVYKNGRRVTWRGKWRDAKPGDEAQPQDDARQETGRTGATVATAAAAAAIPLAAAKAEASTLPPLPPAAPERPAPLRLGLAPDAGLAGLPHELGALVASGNIILDAQGEADLALMPLEGLAKAQGWQAVARLYPAEIHLVARPGIASLADLRMRSIVAGDGGAPAEAALRSLLDRLDSGAILASGDPAEALTRLGATGGPDAVILFGAPSPERLAAAPAGARLIALPYDSRLGEDWLPATHDTDATANLRPNGAPVDTLAMGLVLVARMAEPGSERFQRMEAFTKALFAQAEAQPRDGADQKWASVNLAASVSGLPRFAPAQDRIATQPAKSAAKSAAK